MASAASDLYSRVATAVSSATPDSDSTPTPSTPSVSDTPVETQASEPETPETPTTSVEDFEFDDSTPKAETPAAAPEGEADETDGDSGIKGPDGKPLTFRQLREHLVKDPRGRRLYSGFQLARELEKPVDQGGLGFVPSVDQLKEMHRDSQDLKLMAHEFHNGNPEYSQNWLRSWFAPRQFQNGQVGYTAGAQQVAKGFLQSLQSMSSDPKQPENYRNAAAGMYRDAALPAVMNHIEDLYSRGLSETDPERRLVLLNGARILEEDITGKMRDLPPGIDTTEYKPNGAQQADPRQASLDAKLQRITQFEQQQVQQANQQFTATLNSQVNDGLAADVKKALEPLAAALPARLYSAQEKQFIQEVNDWVKENPAHLRDFIMARDAARSSRSPQDIKAAADALRSVMRQRIKSLRTEYLKDAQPHIEAASAKRHATLQEAGQKTGTSSVSQPATRSLAGSAAPRQAGESYAAYLERRTIPLISGVA